MSSLAPTKPKAKPDPFVMKLLTALATATKGKPPQTWVSVDDLDLNPTRHLHSTIERAVEAGWISAGDRPAHLITITADGLKQIAG